MKRLAELLEGEVLDWPNVTSRPMFGMTGLYSGGKIFARSTKEGVCLDLAPKEMAKD